MMFSLLSTWRECKLFKSRFAYNFYIEIFFMQFIHFLYRMTGQEEQIGGFDLICKGNPILNETSLNPSMLGCFNNRSQQLEKLSKIIANKLEQAQQQWKEDQNVDARKSNAKETMQAIPPSSTPDINALNVRKAKSISESYTKNNL